MTTGVKGRSYVQTDEEYVMSRECHWKNVLLTRDFGYNIN